MLIHVIDLSATDGRDPIQDYEQLNLELGHYNELLTKLPQIIALNKIDIPDAEANLERVQKYFDKRKVFPISAVTGEGVNPLIQQAYRSLQYLETRARKEAETTIVFEEELPQSRGHGLNLPRRRKGLLSTVRNLAALSS